MTSNIIVPYTLYASSGFGSKDDISGAYNMGANCWWNALIQCLLSAPAFIDELRKAVKDESIINAASSNIYLIRAILTLAAGKTGDNIDTPAALIVLAKICRMRGLTLDLFSQEGTANGFVVLLDALALPQLCTRFRSKYNKNISCGACGKTASSMDDRSFFITIYEPWRLKSRSDYEQYLIRHESPLIDYKCSNCGKECTKAVESLRLLREVLILVINRGINDNNTGKNYFLPDTIEMPSIKGGSLCWKMTGRIQHSGFIDPRNFTSSGHYWADVLRGGKWYNANDSSIREVDAPASIDIFTHMIFYHMV